MSFLSRRHSRRDSVLEIPEEAMRSLALSIKSESDAIHEAEAAEGALSFTNFEDQLFDSLSEGQNKVYLSRFVWELQSKGLQKDDFRLRETMKMLKQAQRTLASKGQDVGLDRKTFKECINPNVVLIKRAVEFEFVIPMFQGFRSRIEAIFEECKANTQGTVSSYIPQLARFDPNNWGVSICTIDGQRHHMGDTEVTFTMCDTHHPISYAVCYEDMPWETLETYIGEEPSGETSKSIKLDGRGRPHNPMINAGAIVTASLIKNDLRMADRFDYVSQQFKRLAGYEFLGFNNAVYLSERETADRNFALGYYMQENDCFPEGVKLSDTLDFYFQLCSVEATCESASVMAATLANGGVCPMTGEQVLTGEAVRNTLSLMHSCGMYDYSGQFAFNVGLPGKSGVSGAIILVIPNVMGVCLWSPPLDKFGNSIRGIQFCEKLVREFNFHQYDNLVHATQKHDPRRKSKEKNSENDIYMLLFGAHNGDIDTLKRLFLNGVDMSGEDYDGRTALHLCSAGGHLECVQFLLKVCKVPANPKDRYGHTPLSEAKDFQHTHVQQFLEQYINAHPQM